MPGERTPADRLNEYASIETEQARHVRDAADAIFKPKQQTEVVEDASGETVVTALPEKRHARTPRILTVRQPEPELASEPKASSEPQEATSRQQGPEIPASKYGRIRALATHGMTIKQVAELYGVGARKIEQIVSKAKQAR